MPTVKIPFRKMHGLGNCFIMVDDTGGGLEPGVDLRQLATAVCDRNFGIGADGLILARGCEDADFEMAIFNEDGSTAEMCGNGVRCFSRFVTERGLTQSPDLRIRTLAGIILTRAVSQELVEVDMGEPRLHSEDVLPTSHAATSRVEAYDRTFSFVSMGNPHAITFVHDYDFDWRAVGRNVETFERFPHKTNVEFARVLSPTEVEVKVWERGCGETMACGTGACAVTVAGVLEGVLERREVAVHLPGGTLRIEWRLNNHVMMTGSTVNVCEGVYWF